MVNPNKGTKGTKEISILIAEENIGQVLSNVPDSSTILSKNRVGLELNE